jgi:hypothetical protein
VFIGISRELMKGEGFLRNPLKKTDAAKMPTCGTIVPCEEHFCALSEAIL